MHYCPLKRVAKKWRDTINRSVSHATVLFIESGSTRSFFFPWDPTTRTHDNSLMQKVMTPQCVLSIESPCFFVIDSILQYFPMTGQLLFLVKGVLGLGFESHWLRDITLGALLLCRKPLIPTRISQSFHFVQSLSIWMLSGIPDCVSFVRFPF